MERKGWVALGVVAALAALGLFALGSVLVNEWREGCRPTCPTHKLYVAYDGSVEHPLGYGAPRVAYDRATLDRELPGLIPYMERSQAESLVEVKDPELMERAVAHFRFGDEDRSAPIEFEGHYYVVTWERLGDEE